MAALLIPGLAFISALVLVAIANTANVQTKAQVESQGSILQFFKDAITGKALVHQITTLTRAAVSRWALSSLRPVTAWFVALNALVLNIFRTQTQTIEGTADALERLRGHTIPNAAKQAALPAAKQAKSAQAKANQASSTAKATSASFTRYRTATAPRIAHATHAVDVTIPQQLGRVKTREDKLSSDAQALRERTTSLENGAVKTFEWIRTHPLSAVSGVFAGAVAVALTRMGWGVLRCRSWRNLGRRLTCGMGGLLLDLLNGVIDVLVIADLCQITGVVTQVAESEPVQAALTSFITGIDDLLRCQNVKRPPELLGYWTELPPAQPFAALPAAA